MMGIAVRLVVCPCLLVVMCCPPAGHEIRSMAGWQVHVSKRLLQQEGPATARALELLKVQLEEVVRVVPKPAVTRLQQVPLWFSPEYPGVRPTAEYHLNRQWLCEHGHDPAMAKAVEFTNIRLFEKEAGRMPCFAFHELAHAYHDQVLGFDNVEVQAAYEAAEKRGRYDKVKRWTGERITEERAYAMTNAKEYFAESSEAYFGRNDFYPFTRTELKEHDPQRYDPHPYRTPYVRRNTAHGIPPQERRVVHAPAWPMTSRHGQGLPMRELQAVISCFRPPQHATVSWHPATPVP